ncbi:hypothetical protein GGX14DRAFT_409328 [Mycena pura]|uniref:Uncharacterized protein n=1 Tax=Mycena pura TaxID=153505 RepID=A0AAD6Y0F6_9AGAR|nr:hypothetical protein GGX14DRAFT_409328 [Mycena pura]
MVHQMTEKKALWRGSTRGVGNRESVRLQNGSGAARAKIWRSRIRRKLCFQQADHRADREAVSLKLDQQLIKASAHGATGPGPWIYMWRREKGRPMYSSMGKLYRLADMVKDQTICSDWETTCTVELLTKWPKENQDSRKFIDTTELDRKYSRGSSLRAPDHLDTGMCLPSLHKIPSRPPAAPFWWARPGTKTSLTIYTVPRTSEVAESVTLR